VHVRGEYAFGVSTRTVPALRLHLRRALFRSRVPGLCPVPSSVLIIFLLHLARSACIGGVGPGTTIVIGPCAARSLAVPLLHYILHLGEEACSASPLGGFFAVGAIHVISILWAFGLASRFAFGAFAL